jgi:hypothetical protein
MYSIISKCKCDFYSNLGTITTERTGHNVGKDASLNHLFAAPVM